MNLNSSILKLCLLVGFIATGCVTHREEVTANSKYRTDYAVGQVYRSLKPLFIDQFGLKRVGDFQVGPSTIEEYEKGDKKKWPNIVGLLPTGTEVKITHIIVERNLEIGNMAYIYSQILTGPFSNAVVNLSFVSKINYSGNSLDLEFVDPEFLELVRTE